MSLILSYPAGHIEELVPRPATWDGLADVAQRCFALPSFEHGRVSLFAKLLDADGHERRLRISRHAWPSLDCLPDMGTVEVEWTQIVPVRRGRRTAAVTHSEAVTANSPSGLQDTEGEVPAEVADGVSEILEEAGSSPQIFKRWKRFFSKSSNIPRLVIIGK